MARLPTIKRINRGDFTDAEPWFERFLVPLNQFIESIYFAIDRQLTFQENFRAQVRSQEFRTPSTYPTDFTPVNFSVGVEFFVQGVLLMNVKRVPRQETITSAVSLDWQLVNGVVQIRHVAGLQASTDYSLSVLII